MELKINHIGNRVAFKISGIIFRLANVVGPKSSHGILFDMHN